MATRKTAGRMKSNHRHVHRLLLKLEGSEATIWRRISVPGNMTLADPDHVIQSTMGWTNSRMHLFAIDGTQYGMSDKEWVDDKPVLPDEEFTLDEVLRRMALALLELHDHACAFVVERKHE